MIITTPFLLMIRHEAQRFLTEALTFKFPPANFYYIHFWKKIKSFRRHL